MLLTIGELCREAREKTGMTRRVAARLIGVDERTMRNLESQHIRFPIKSTRHAIERTYGWAQGSLMNLWEQRGMLTFGDVTEEMLPKTPFAEGTEKLKDLFTPIDPQGPLAKARDLSTKELLAELTFRVMMMENRQSQDLDQ